MHVNYQGVDSFSLPYRWLDFLNNFADSRRHPPNKMKSRKITLRMERKITLEKGFAIRKMTRGLVKPQKISRRLLRWIVYDSTKVCVSIGNCTSMNMRLAIFISRISSWKSNHRLIYTRKRLSINQSDRITWTKYLAKLWNKANLRIIKKKVCIADIFPESPKLIVWRGVKFQPWLPV